MRISKTTIKTLLQDQFGSGDMISGYNYSVFSIHTDRGHTGIVAGLLRSMKSQIEKNYHSICRKNGIDGKNFKLLPFVAFESGEKSVNIPVPDDCMPNLLSEVIDEITKKGLKMRLPQWIA